MAGQSVHPFDLPGTSGTLFSSADFRGKLLVIYFYPKDNTPGCTTEGMDFANLHPQFQSLGCEVFGISRDSMASHEGFKAKLNLPFELLSDEEEKACEIFGVIKMKNMYGKKVRGIERSTFVLDREGNLVKEWRGVKVPNHAQDVLDVIRTLA